MPAVVARASCQCWFKPRLNLDLDFDVDMDVDERNEDQACR